MMVSSTKLIVHFAIPVPKSWCANPNHLKIEKLENDLQHFGKFCPQTYKDNSLNKMPKLLSLSPHLTSAHKSSALSIAEMELGNWCSNLHHQGTNICLILLLLTCANLAFLVMCNDRLCIKPAFRLRIVRPMCDGRSPLEAPLFAVSHVWCAYPICCLPVSMPDPTRPSVLLDENR